MMHRLRTRILFVFSISLLCATTVLWLWSEGNDAHLTFGTGYRRVYLMADHGDFDMEYETEKSGRIPKFDDSQYYEPESLLIEFLGHRRNRRFAGIWTDSASFSTNTRYLTRDGTLTISVFAVGIPGAYWVAAAALVTAYTGLRWWRARRRPAGMCESCGYDLHATPDRCPECGASRV